MIADDFRMLLAMVEGLSPEFCALERIRDNYNKYLGAAARLTKLANDAHDRDELLNPDEVRKALGNAYLGGALK